MEKNQKVKRQKMDDVTLLKRFERPSLLSKALMTMDGFLLSTFANMGSCIPDKLVDKKELVKELEDEMYGYGKTVNKNEKTCNSLTWSQRRHSVTALEPTTVEPLAKDVHRRSWGPDNTWSSQFFSLDSLTDKKCKETCKWIKSDKSNKQKLQKLIEVKSDKEDREKRKKDIMKMFSWIKGEGLDYVHTEKVANLADVEIILDVMLSFTIPIQLTFKVNSSTDISITYQFLPKFKEDYMILKISRSHCMVMRAF